MRTPEQTEALLDKLESIISEYDAADDRFKRGQWGEKFKERFSPYEEKLKKLNGDDFDIMKESYDEYHKDFSDLTDDDYANSLEENIKKVLQRIWPDEPEKVEEATQAISEESEEPAESTEITIESKPGEKEESKEDDKITSDEEAKSFRAIKKRGDGATGADNDWPGNPKTIRSDEACKETYEDQFVKELEEYKKNMPKRG